MWIVNNLFILTHMLTDLKKFLDLDSDEKEYFLSGK